MLSLSKHDIGEHFYYTRIHPSTGSGGPVSLEPSNLMTTIAMIVAMLPIALAKGTASEWKNGLAWVIIGGLFSSLILTVYLVPMGYYLVERIKEKINLKFKAGKIS